MKASWASAAFLLACGVCATPGPSIGTDDSHNSTTGPLAPRDDGIFKTASNAVTGTFKNALGIYGANFQPQDIPAGEITHVLYAFADIASDGTVISSDPWADTDKRYDTDSWGDVGNNVYGCVKQLFLHKKKHRNLKVLLSIGGWTYSPKFAPIAATEEGRRKFASSAVKLVADWGFDGLDIDWEYPQNAAEAQNLVDLLRTCRELLDAYAAEHAPGYHFTMTVASPAGAQNYNTMLLEAMDPLLDAWHLMAYDYAGAWDSTTGHQANIYPDPSNAAATKFNTETAVNAYLQRGIDPGKLVMGVPLYGRSFMNTQGMGLPYSGIGAGSIEDGIWLYKDLPRPGAQEVWDNVVEASYSYDPASQELITYDTVTSTTRKAEWLIDRGLGGAVFWEASGDRKGAGSLITTLANTMISLDGSQNLLSYPISVYDNIRNGME
ncbi:Chitinase 1 [Scedosporium apiospermum]|uniref:chitinase n=1 Tax=Pseudallescheria apiosperma TaxID=563466 RepID=A0A084GB13_PSEDA|nr:Chitinase 1 [Scedosporium apiospermum]KEZ44525.1 Chitinase 1 [Scedosporium apiospermum]